MTKCLVKNSEGDSINFLQETGQYYIQNTCEGQVVTVSLSLGDLKEFIRNVRVLAEEEAL